MDTPELPLEIYHLIAADSESAYRAMLAVPSFARDIDVSRRYDYMILFKHEVKITRKRIIWLRAGVDHRLDGPAVEHIDGYRAWYVNGVMHRTGGPARLGSDGEWEWKQNGKTHRLDGPAFGLSDGYRAWYQNDLLHRLDGPAIKYADGRGIWCVNGKHVEAPGEWKYTT